MRADIEALRTIEREKGIDFDTIVQSLEGALASAYKRGGGQADDARVVIDRESGEVTVLAQELDADGNVVEEWEDPPSGFNRIVAQTTRQVLLQRLREAEREMTFGEYAAKQGDLVSGTVQIHDRNLVVLDLGNAEAILPAAEQVPTEEYRHGTHLRAVIVEVRRSARGVQIVCSRTHPSLVHGLFALEVPEIADGIVRVERIAREAGYRTKIAVSSSDPAVDPVGACVGQAGGRVLRIVEDLGGEKVDIIPYAAEPAAFVANALSPAKVAAVYQYPEEEFPTAVVVVPDYQLSLAIGREGQNARLAARLTGWRIDIKSETQYAEERAAFDAAVARGEIDEFGRPLTGPAEPAGTVGPEESQPSGPLG